MDSRKVCQLLLKQAVYPLGSTGTLLDRNGNVIRGADGCKQIARTFLGPPQPSTSIPSSPIDPALQEVTQACRYDDAPKCGEDCEHPQMSKCPGEDELSVDIYKHAGDVIAPCLEQIFGRAWEMEVVPTD